MFSPKREPAWDVVEHKEVAPVPAYFDESEVEIVEIFQSDISQTFTFDSPPSSPTIKTRFKLPCISHSRSSSISAPIPLSRSSTSSSGDSSLSGDTFHSEHTRNAIIFAREQLLKSSEFRKLGANVLFFEGWTVTKLQKGDQFRLQVRYAGRPARAIVSPSASPSPPPFLDIIY